VYQSTVDLNKEMAEPKGLKRIHIQKVKRIFF